MPRGWHDDGASDGPDLSGPSDRLAFGVEPCRLSDAMTMVDVGVDRVVRDQEGERVKPAWVDHLAFGEGAAAGRNAHARPLRQDKILEQAMSCR